LPLKNLEENKIKSEKTFARDALSPISAFKFEDDEVHQVETVKILK
jgi:hypothetical protein